MIRKRRLFLLTALIIFTFILTVFYLMRLLSDTEKAPKNSNDIIHEQILYHLTNLPEFYKVRVTTKDSIIDSFINNIKAPRNARDSLEGLWKEVDAWVTKTQLTNFSSTKIGSVTHALKQAKITGADIDTRGTQLKLFLTLEVGRFFSS